MLYDIMKTYATTDMINADEADHTDNNGNFVITKFAADSQFAGKTVTAAHARHQSTWLANPATDHAFPESFSVFADRWRLWSNSEFSNSPLAHNQGPAAYDTIPKFLRLDKTMVHFTECVSMARIQNSFLKDSTSFGQLDYVEGPETAIFCDIRFNGRLPVAQIANDVTAAEQLPDLRAKNWYPRVTTTAYADLFMYEEGVDYTCYLNAKHTLTNASLRFRVRMTAGNNNVTEITALPDTQIGTGTDEFPNHTGLHFARAGPWFNRNHAGTANTDGALCTIWKRTDGFATQVLAGRQDFIRDMYYL